MSGAGKGDRPRPCRTGPEEQAIRHQLAFGFITFAECEQKYRELAKAGLIMRDGRRVHGRE